MRSNLRREQKSMLDMKLLSMRDMITDTRHKQDTAHKLGFALYESKLQSDIELQVDFVDWLRDFRTSFTRRIKCQ